MKSVISGFVSAGLMPDPKGLAVWDLGTGSGVFAIAMADLGARKVIATDFQENGITDPRVFFQKGGFTEAMACFGENGQIPVDLVFMHLMTEHVDNLPLFFKSLYSAIPAGAKIFIHHDNYYQPVGHHDHGFLFLNEQTWNIEPQGVCCWLSDDKCAASASHRASLPGDTWSSASDATRDPLNCHNCNYLRRSQPWAHLIYADTFMRTFPEVWFRDNLNALTPNQLTLFAQMAGFEIVAHSRTWAMNVPSADLVNKYGAESVSTFTCSLLASKREIHLN